VIVWCFFFGLGNWICGFFRVGFWQQRWLFVFLFCMLRFATSTSRDDLVTDAKIALENIGSSSSGTATLALDFKCNYTTSITTSIAIVGDATLCGRCQLRCESWRATRARRHDAEECSWSNYNAGTLNITGATFDSNIVVMIINSLLNIAELLLTAMLPGRSMVSPIGLDMAEEPIASHGGTLIVGDCTFLLNKYDQSGFWIGRGSYWH
jgi:hypothetical protein